MRKYTDKGGKRQKEGTPAPRGLRWKGSKLMKSTYYAAINI